MSGSNGTLDPNPSTDPTSYPGIPVPGSCVLTHERLLPMAVSESAWLVEMSTPINKVLLRYGAKAMDHRRPVLAIGSNSSAGQLRHKWRADPNMVVPMTVVEVMGIGVGHSAHVSRAGYIPYAPIAQDVTKRYFALWLTDSQIVDLDLTEPNYFPTVLHGSDYRARLESGQLLEEYLIYRGRWGVVSDEEGRAVPAGTQVRALEMLNSIGRESFSHDQLAADAEARDRARDVLQGRSVQDRLIWREETPGESNSPHSSQQGG